MSPEKGIDVMFDENSEKARKLRILAVAGLVLFMVAVWLPVAYDKLPKDNGTSRDFYTFLPQYLLMSGICVAGCIAVWKRREMLDLDLFLIGFVLVCHTCSMLEIGAGLMSVYVVSAIRVCALGAVLVAAVGLHLMSHDRERLSGPKELFPLWMAIAGMALAVLGTFLPFIGGNTLFLSDGLENTAKWGLQLVTLLVSVIATLCVVKRRKSIARILGFVGAIYLVIILAYTPAWISETGGLNIIRENMYIGYHLMRVGCVLVIVSALMLRFMTRDQYGTGKKWPAPNA